MNELPAPTTRPRHGRWLGGVCAGLARRWDVAPGPIRSAFVLGTLLFGLGALVYVAAWLILPAESIDGTTAGQRGIVLLAQLTGAVLGLATLAVAGGLATLFGFGWAVVGLAFIVLVCVLAGWARLGPGWALLPIGALVLPSVALAVGNVHLEPSADDVILKPRVYTELQPEYKAGLGLLSIDLRKTDLPQTGTIRLRIDAGVRRTLIALPHDRCVRVRVTQRRTPFLLKVADALASQRALGEPQVLLFGGVGEQLDDTDKPSPTLRIEFSSAGGDLYVRDYPDDVDPWIQPDWPGRQVFPENRPDTTGLSKSESKRRLRGWRKRHAEQERSMERVAKLLEGPCTEKI